MHAKHVLMTAIAVVSLAGAAIAHPGAPGHVHAEMSTLQNVLHAALNWAPVAGLAAIAIWGVRRGARDNA